MASQGETTEGRNGEREQPRRVSAKKPASQSAKEWIKSIAIALVIWFFVRSLLVEAFRIPSGSMENTLQIGDFLFVNKALYGAEIPLLGTRLPAFREPDRLDIVIFNSPEEPGINVVKRVVGMPGDTISMAGGDLYVNGRPSEEPYAVKSTTAYDPVDPRMRDWQLRYLAQGRDHQTYVPTLKNWGPLVIPPDSFFVMGDNRDNSYDSRYWGFLGRDRVQGRPLFIYYSFDRTGLMPLPFLTNIRWNRIFLAPD
ncbi:MAG: signal peptidase I [Gemmatimonadota bacterium]|nr:signal peptidase I [Gemmatimonadota bacterium]